VKKKNLRIERRQKRREENKISILKAAESVLARKGYSFATMDDIAEEAQFSKATLYQYFKSKGNMFYEIILNSLDDMNRELVRIREKSIGSGEKLKEIIRYTFEFFEQKENISRIFLMERNFILKFFNFMAERQKQAMDNQDLKYFKNINPKRKVLRDVVTKILADGVESGEFRRMNVQDTAYVFTSLLHGFYFTKFWRKKRYDIEEETNLIHGIFLEGIKKA
jgi:AcrR family transcriptional regulator